MSAGSTFTKICESTLFNALCAMEATANAPTRGQKFAFTIDHAMPATSVASQAIGAPCTGPAFWS